MGLEMISPSVCSSGYCGLVSREVRIFGDFVATIAETNYDGSRSSTRQAIIRRFLPETIAVHTAVSCRYQSISVYAHGWMLASQRPGLPPFMRQ